jgi:hypothetical protein
VIPAISDLADNSDQPDSSSVDNSSRRLQKNSNGIQSNSSLQTTSAQTEKPVLVDQLMPSGGALEGTGNQNFGSDFRTSQNIENIFEVEVIDFVDVSFLSLDPPKQRKIAGCCWRKLGVDAF